MALLPLTGLETHPAGESNVGGIISGNWETLEAIAEENGFHRASYAALAYAASVTLDFTAARHRMTSLGGNITVAFSNLEAGRDATLILRGDASSRTLTWPAGVVWLGSAAPGTLAANKTLSVRFFATGATASDVIATWQVEP